MAEGARNPGTETLPRTSVAAGVAALRRLLPQPLGAVEVDRPALEDLPYRDLIRAFQRGPGFKLDFNRLDPPAALAMVCDQLFGPGSFSQERAGLAADISDLASLMQALVGGRPAISIRTYFAPGDLVWHVDRVCARQAYRLVWPIGRPVGMHLTERKNIETDIYAAFMRREFPQLCRLDTRVLRAGATVEALWAHRPQQLEAMRSGQFPFLIDADRVLTVSPGAASIHRVETPDHAGTFHRSDWGNRDAPGFQIVITASSEGE